MSKLRLLVLDEYLEDVVREFSRQGVVQMIDVKDSPEYAGKISPVTENPAAVKASELLARIYFLIDTLNISEERDFFGSLKKEPKKIVWKDSNSAKQLSKVEEMVSEVERSVVSKSDKLVKLGEEKAFLEPLKNVLTSLGRLKVDVSSLGESRFLYTVAGLITPQDLDKLEKLLKNSKIDYLLKEAGNSGKISMLLVVSRDRKHEVDKILEGLEFQKFVLDPSKALWDLGKVSKRLAEIDREIKELNEGLEEDRRKYCDRLLALREVVQIEKYIAESRNYMGKTRRVYVLTGWVPEKNFNNLVKRVEELSHGHVVVKADKPKEDESVPTKLDNPSLFKPFEVLVETFGLPSYRELDPTPVMAFTFPLFYGLMFGDVGHGLMLVLLGLFLAKIARKVRSVYSLGLIVFACGLFATFFGLMYGEAFGMSQEEQEKILGFRFPILVRDMEGNALISPLESPEHTIGFLQMAVLIGVVHVGSGLVLGFINKLMEKQYLAALAGPLPKMWMYYGAVYLFLTYWTDFALWGQNIGLVVFLIVVPLILLFLGEVIKHLPEIDLHHLPAQLGEGAFEVFDSALIFLSNSISYSRIFALALVHGGLFMALFSVVEPVRAMPYVGILAWFIMVALGTVGILGLEALIVFLHSLRLHYYEWFTKFYAASGVKFTPFKVERVYTKTE